MAEYYAATGQEGGPDREGHRERRGAQARARHRALDRPLRGHDAVHRRPAPEGGAGLRERGRDGGGDAARLQPRPHGDRDKLVAIYPEEGTFDSDSPFFTLKAPWVSAEQAAGAKAFQEYLAEEITPEVAAKSGFRPANRETAPVAPITVANGADPKQPERVLALPEPRVLAAIKKAWRRDRKPANILLVLDTSGSMNAEGRLTQAKAGLEVFFRGVEPQDSVGLTIFSDQIQPLIAPAPLSKNRDGAARPRAQPDRRGRDRVLRRDRRVVRRRARAEGDGPHQRRRAADRRRGHGLAAHRRRGRRAPRGPGRLRQPRARVHDRLLLGRDRRARPARADRGGLGRPRATRARRRTSSPSTARSPRSSSAMPAASSLRSRPLQPRADRERAARPVQRRAARGGADRGHPARRLRVHAARRGRALPRRRGAHVLRRGRGEQGARARARGAPQAGSRPVASCCARRTSRRRSGS